MLTPDEINTYHEKGYVTPDYRLPAALLDDIRSRHDRLLQAHPEFDNYCPSLLAYDTGFLAAARDETLLAMVQQLIGPDIALWNSSFFAKPANGGHATPWHQDGEYWPIEPLATCTVWIAIDAATPENGCLQVIPGSHKEQRLRQHNTNNASDLTLNQELDQAEFDSNAAEFIELEPGQVSLHDVYLVHGSDANHSEHSRRGMTLRIMPTSSYYNRQTAHEKAVAGGFLDHSERTLYLLGGVDQSGRNDFSQRQ